MSLVWKFGDFFFVIVKWIGVFRKESNFERFCEEEIREVESF